MPALLLSLIMPLFFLLGCSEKPDENAKANLNINAKKEILLVMKSLTNPFYVEMEKGARKAADELGFTLYVRSGTNETSLEQQASFIEEYMQKGIHAVVIAPADSVGIIPVLKRVQLRGIEIVNIDNKIDAQALHKAEMKPVPFISVDNEHGAYLSANAIAKVAPKGSKAIVIEGIRTAQNANQRKSGALRAFKEAGIPVVATESASWKIEEAYGMFRKLHEEHPNANLIFCANDMMAMGVLQYAQEKNIKNLLIAAYDDIPDARKMIQDGKMHSTVNQQADMQGYYGAKFAFERSIGKEVPLEKIVDVRLVTR